MIKNKHFQVFGSKFSIDLDCMVFVDKIPSIYESHNLCNEYSNIIRDITKTKKEINTNICKSNDGIIVEVFKGTPDEVNNSLYLTYDLHEQWFPNKVKRLVERDIELKILRTCRTLLSFWSRSEKRSEVRKALKGDIYDKIKVIEEFDILKHLQLNKNVGWDDYLKMLAFQLGQTISLIEGKELYSKESICKIYPCLCPFLNRKKVNDIEVLEKYKRIFINMIKDWKFSKTKEIY